MYLSQTVNAPPIINITTYQNQTLNPQRLENANDSIPLVLAYRV